MQRVASALSMPIIRCLSLLAVLTALAGCASFPAYQFPSSAPVELTATPFFPQRDYQCGPAALATVLASSGVSVTADDLTNKVYLPGRQGSLQVELVAAARGYGRVAYVMQPQFDVLLANVSAGYPVLVLQNLALKHFPQWHYAVVIGFDAQKETLILRSGTTERVEVSARKFMRSWALGERWGMVVLKTDQLPARAEEGRYLQGAVGLETVGKDADALRAYETALKEWPSSAVALLGVGNVRYRRGELALAEEGYRKLVERHPRHAVGRNNLAQVLLERGKAEEALKEIQEARAVLEDEQFLSAIDDTEREIRRVLAKQ